MYPGVFSASKKDGTIYFRSSFTYKNKHISLGSFSTEKDAHKAYLEATEIMTSKKVIKRPAAENPPPAISLEIGISGDAPMQF